MAAPLLSWDQYTVAWAGLHGGVDPRRARPSVRGWLRTGYRLAKLSARVRIRPGGVTAAGLLACVFVPVFAVRGRMWTVLAAGLVIAAAVADTADGALAVLTSRTTRLGYVYDSLVDRLGEVCWLVALWLIGVPGYVVVTAGGLAWLHEYARSRANAAGMTEIGAITVGERPTRVILTVIGLGLAGLTGLASAGLASAGFTGLAGADLPAGVATLAVAVWVVLALIGFGQLFVAVHRALAGRTWPSWAPPGAIASRASTSDASTSGATGEGWAGRDFDGIVADKDLLREMAELTALPAGTAVYTSRSVSPSGRHSQPDQDESESVIPPGCGPTAG